MKRSQWIYETHQKLDEALWWSKNQPCLFSKQQLHNEIVRPLAVSLSAIFMQQDGRYLIKLIWIRPAPPLTYLCKICRQVCESWSLHFVFIVFFFYICPTIFKPQHHQLTKFRISLKPLTGLCKLNIRNELLGSISLNDKIVYLNKIECTWNAKNACSP